MTNLKNKKGVSPLIATVLLIGFAVAIAGVLFVWIRSSTGELGQKQSEKLNADSICLKTVIGFEVTRSGNTITVKNGSPRTIKDIFVQINPDTADIKTYMASSLKSDWAELSNYGSSSFDIPGLSPSSKVKVFPQIIIEANEAKEGTEVGTNVCSTVSKTV
ncbi:hypothetical protein J4403_03985 [Candidatus Woesearchaeota archaeon]|nr:hypothetical protein [Candidatus Woesearchaeota archaeon]